ATEPFRNGPSCASLGRARRPRGRQHGRRAMMQTGAVRPRGWYYGWNIVAVLVVTQIAANGMALSAFSLFLHDWSSDLKTSISTLALAMTPLTLVGAVSGSIIGGMADRYPARWLIGAGILGLAPFDLGISLVTQAWQLL